MRGLYRVIVAAVCAVFWLLHSSNAHAQDNDALRFFMQNPQVRPWFRSEPQQQRLRPRNPSDDPAARRRARPIETQEAAAPPAIPPSVFVHVVGDSLSELLAQGLKEQLAERPEIAVIKRGRSSSGLVRDDYYDWIKSLRELVEGPDKVDLIVMMIGSNDRQQLRDETGSHDFLSEKWRELYIKRLDALLFIARGKSIPLVWVGMPSMQASRLSADMLALNELFRDRIVKGGATYVDIWEGFTNEQGQYVAVGPDISGETVRLRTADGIHFTKAGARKLGFFAGRDVNRLIRSDRVQGIDIAALPPDLSEELRRSAAPPATPGVVLAPPNDAQLPPLRINPERPLVGPLVALNTAPTSPNAVLFKSAPQPVATEMQVMIDQALGLGLLPAPKPGRTDDFRWPRP